MDFRPRARPETAARDPHLRSALEARHHTRAARAARPRAMHDAVRRATDVIDVSYRDLRGPEDVAAAVGLPLETFRKAFRRERGVWPREYLEGRRVEEAKRLLAETDLRVYEVASAVGWGREDTASRAFHRATGLTMREYRRAASGGRP